MVRKHLPEEVTSEQSSSWIKWESQAGICGEQLLDTTNHTSALSLLADACRETKEREVGGRSREGGAWRRVWYNRSKIWAIYTMLCFLAAPFLKIKNKQEKWSQYIQHIIATHNHCRRYYPEMYEYVLLPSSLRPSFLLSSLKPAGHFPLTAHPILDQPHFKVLRCQMWPRPPPGWCKCRAQSIVVHGKEFRFYSEWSKKPLESWKLRKVCVCWGGGWGLGEVTWFHLIFKSSLNRCFIKDEFCFTHLVKGKTSPWSISLRSN